MPKSSRGGRRNTPATTAANNQPTQPVGNPVINATPMTDADAQQLRDDQDSIYDGSVTAAIKMYISGKPGTGADNVDGLGHSLSQSMNYLLDQGVDFNTDTVDAVNKKFGIKLSQKSYASMQFTNAYMEAGAHPLGKDTVLTRGAHDDVLKNVFGISDYTKLTENQLKSRLIGGTLTTTSYTSTSYDASKSPFIGNSAGLSGGREVIYKIKAGANTQVLMGAKAQAEIILNKGTNLRVTNVSYTGNTATPRLSTTSKKQIIIELETY